MPQHSSDTAGRWIVTVAVAAAVAMLGSRNTGVPAPFAAAFSVFLLLATWASVRHWYRQVEHFDLFVHVLTPGSLAAAAYFVLAQHRLLPTARGRMAEVRSAALVLEVTIVGVTTAVLWEFYEWVPSSSPLAR